MRATARMACAVLGTGDPAPLARAGLSLCRTPASISRAAPDSAHQSTVATERMQSMFPTKSDNVKHPPKISRSYLLDKLVTRSGTFTEFGHLKLEHLLLRSGGEKGVRASSLDPSQLTLLSQKVHEGPRNGAAALCHDPTLQCRQRSVTHPRPCRVTWGTGARPPVLPLHP